jgi:hypothetical protein
LERLAPENGYSAHLFRTVIVASAAMLLWMGRPLVTGQIPFTGDLLHFHYPLRDFYATALARGHRFDWMPSLLGGFYVVGEGQLGAYHPIHWALYRFIPLDAAFAIELVIAYPWLFAGTYLMLRRWCGSGAAAVGAMTFTFCGFNLSHGVHPNMIGIVAHVPWLLWAAHGTFAATTRGAAFRGCAAIALLTGSQLLLGHPQAVWFSALIEMAYVLMLFLTRAGARRVASVGVITAGKVLGLGIGAIQVAATWNLVQHSTRPLDDVAYATSFALRPLHLLQLLHPYLLWGRVLRWTESPGAGDEFAAYGGIVSMMLAVWWLAGYRTRHKAGQRSTTDTFGLCAAAFGVVGLWLSLGAAGGLYYMQTWIPIVSQFRVPARYVLFTQLALAVLTALAMSRLLDTSTPHDGRTRALWAPWGVAAVSSVSAIWLVACGIAAWGSREAMLAAAIGPALAVVAAALLTVATRGARWAVIGLVVLAAGDHALYGLGGPVAWHDYINRRDVPGLLATDGMRPGDGRLMHGGFPNLYTLAGYRMLDGYVAIEPRRTLDYRSPRALRLAEVRYIHTRFQEIAHIPHAEPLGRVWLRVEPPVARARLLTRARVSGQPAIDLESIDIDAEALVTRDLDLAGGPAGALAILRDNPGDIRVATAAGGRQLLALTEPFDEGWMAAVDGQPASVERLYGDFIGCVVPAGEHVIEFTFAPLHLAVGGAVSLAGTALAMLLAASTLNSRRSRRRAPEGRPA